MTKPFSNKDGNFQTIKRAIEVLKLLKENTDEQTTISQKKLMELMQSDPLGNARSLADTIDKILLAVNPPEYDEENTDQYRIRYKGYEDNLISVHYDVKRKKAEELQEIRKAKKEGKEPTIKRTKFARIPSITDLQYVHDFSFAELDALIQVIYEAKTLTEEEKINLIDKVSNLSSKKYRQKWISPRDGKVKSKSVLQGIVENTDKLNEGVIPTFRLLSDAIERRKKVSFVFNGYDYEKKLSPLRDKKGEIIVHTVTPYHVVMYNGKYYMIANHDNYDNASIWRIDLMSEVEILEDSIGRPRKDIKELPARWNATEYMEKHLYMYYDEPIDIQLKIKNNRYTILFDWFGDNFSRIMPLDDEYDLVKVNCSPNAMVKWALQYSDLVEVVGPKRIRDELKRKCNLILDL